MSAFSLVLASLVLAGGLTHEADPPAAAIDARNVEAAEPAVAASDSTASGDPIPGEAGKTASRGRSAEDPNERVCKYVVQTGTRMGSKKCHTRAYWDDMELATRNKMREIDSQPIPVHGN